jgi:GH25 family lysozyme M1 (1,4-beta-N-acetylmuramidase)
MIFLVLDLSSYQSDTKPIDWRAVAGPGVAAVWIKATQGVTGTDEQLVANVAGAAAVGLHFGCYHFLSPDTPVPQQVDHFLGSVAAAVAALAPASRALMLPPMLDVEQHGPGLTVGARALAWLQAVEKALGVKPIAYTGPAFAMEQGLGDTPELAAYPLWEAHYTSRPVPFACPPWDPPGAVQGDAWTLWQWTGTGTMPGIVGKVDISRAKSIPGLTP